MFDLSVGDTIMILWITGVIVLLSVIFFIVFVDAEIEQQEEYANMDMYGNIFLNTVDNEILDTEKPFPMNDTHLINITNEMLADNNMTQNITLLRNCIYLDGKETENECEDYD